MLGKSKISRVILHDVRQKFRSGHHIQNDIKKYKDLTIFYIHIRLIFYCQTAKLCILQSKKSHMILISSYLAMIQKLMVQRTTNTS